MKFCHVTISVKDMEESLRFYTEIIGLPVKRRFPAGPNTEIAFLGEGETEVELFCNQTQKEISIGQDISIGFEVASLQETIASLQQAGISTGEVFKPNPKTSFFFISDPNGVRVQFIEFVK